MGRFLRIAELLIQKVRGHASQRHGVRLGEGVRVGRASARIVHTRPKEMLFDRSRGEIAPAYRNDAGELVLGQRWIETADGPMLDPRDHDVLSEETSHNVKTTVGIDFTFAQTYSSAPGGNGLNYIALSNDTLTESSGSTTLSNEIAANGLSRAQGTYAHSAGTSTATVAKTFTCATSSQACQKAATFSASSSGTMQHALSFTQRTLQVGDSIAVTFTITIT